MVGLARPRPFHLAPIQTFDPSRMIVPALDAKISTLLDNLLVEPSFTISFDKHHEEKKDDDKDAADGKDGAAEGNGQESDSGLCQFIPDECPDDSNSSS